MAGTRITIDANCVINLFDRESASATSVEELQNLLRYALDGKAEVAITTRLEMDLQRDKDEQRRRTLIGMLDMFPVISSVMRLDISRLDEDLLVGEGSERLADEIQKILSPGLTPEDKRFSNKINDIDHLTGHVIDKRDIFVTDDTGIVRKRDQLRGLGIIVMTPAQCVEYLDVIALRSIPRTLPSDSYPSEYHSRGLGSTVTFDYTNNNQRFAIGEGQHLFGTRWSKASNVSIHAYSDEPSVEAIAIAKGKSQISEITAPESYDFSSRTRTAHVGQIVIWRNVNGIYAATKILRVTDDTRGDDTNDLTIEYRILASGERTFAG